MSILILLYVSLIIGIVVSQQFVCLKVKIVEEKLFLECTIDKITYNVIFVRPDGTTYGSCFPPPPPKLITNASIDCLNNITMYPNTNLTVLQLPITDDVFGVWSCKHGTGRSFDSVNVSSRIVEGEFGETGDKVDKSFCLRYMIPIYLISLLVVFMVSNLSCSRQFYDELKEYIVTVVKQCRRGRRRQINEEEPLIDVTDRHHKCSFCGHKTSFAFCSCRKWFCEHCSEEHHRLYKKHQISQMRYYFNYGEHKLQCDTCRCDTPKIVCRTCFHVSCHKSQCKCDHQSSFKRDIISHSPPSKSIHSSEEIIQIVRPELKEQYNLLPDDSVISGLACFSDATVAAIDYKYWNLCVFRPDKRFTKEKLEMEPKALTKVRDGKVAITFAYEKLIGIFEIQMDKIVKIVSENISLKDVGKPYSISYSNGFYAVEIWERKPGFIAIINSAGAVIHKISHSDYSFGFFTSNTLRLALDMQKELFYTSAIGQKSIYCVDFNGNIIWHVTVPSPREIHIVPTDEPASTNILFASNRGHAVYQLIENDAYLKNSDPVGKVLMNNEMDEVQNPEYIAYSTEGKLLCVGMESGKINVYFFQDGL